MTISLTDIFTQQLILQADRSGGWLLSAPVEPSGPTPMSLYIQDYDDQVAVADNLIIEADSKWIALKSFTRFNELDTWCWEVRMTKPAWESYTDPENYSPS